MTSGLTKYGATKQTIAMARAIQKSPQAQAELIRMLTSLNVYNYSNEDGDRRSALAAVFANLARDGGCELASDA